MNHKKITKFFALTSILLITACSAPAHAKTVNAAKMPGFNPANATKALQAALDSGADKVIVPDVGQPWVVTPIQLRSNQTVVFKPGVVILAKKGKFHGLNDSLFTARDVKNIKIIGPGATWRMHKKDYANLKKYKKSEWRMGLEIRGASDITIKGLTIEKTGGDGIYIGTGKRNYSKNITIQNVKLLDNYRQGISVISVDGLLMENVIMADTSGTGPAAGIDFEPNSATNRLSNIVMRNCTTQNNAGGGYQLYLVQLDPTSEPVSIKIENSKSLKDIANGVSITTLNSASKSPKGKITFTNCTFQSSKSSAIEISKPADQLPVIFKNCTIYHPASSNPTLTPIQISSRRGANAPVGGVKFDNVTLIDALVRAPIGYLAHSANSAIKNITGTLIVTNPKGTRRYKLSPALLKKWNPASNFKAVPFINLKDVQWSSSANSKFAKSLGLKEIQVRKTARYGLYAHQGDKVQVDIRYGRIGNYGGTNMAVAITGPKGKKVHSAKVPFRKTASVSFTAPETGLYQIKARPGLNYAFTGQSTNPIGIITSQKGVMLHKAAGTYYFWVPQGTKQFAVRGTGDGNEGFRMVLCRSDGSVVQDIDNIAGLKQITVKPQPNQTGKIWQLKIKPSSKLYFGDQAVQLLGVPPLLSVNREAVIQSK